MNLNIEVGQKFGLLTVLEYANQNTHKDHLYLCKCVCGNEKVVMATSLKRGNTRSCGCLCGRRNVKNLVGERFHKLLVIEEVPISNRRRINKVEWLCMCDCGNTTTASADSLKTNHKKSCGCITNQWKKTDLSGLRFNRLLVLNEVPLLKRKNKKIVEWVCLCDCSKTLTVSTQSLITENTKSCGCYKLENSFNRKSEKSAHWKGGLTPIYKHIRSFLKSNLKWNKNVLIKDKFTCQKCGKIGGKLHAHHVDLFMSIIEQYNIKSLDSALLCSALLDINNGVTLCKDCHKLVHSKNNVNKEFLKE